MSVYLVASEGVRVELDDSEQLCDRITQALTEPELHISVEDLADGFYLALEVMLSSAQGDVRHAAMERMRQLITGELVLE